MNITIDSLIENQKKIAELIESFKEAMNKKKCKEEVLDLMHRVNYYTEDFFIQEELFLKKYKIPSYQQHNEEHKQFVINMLDFHKRLETIDPNICQDVLNYMEEWYKNHILDSDKQIIEYIKKSNIE